MERTLMDEMSKKFEVKIPGKDPFFEEIRDIQATFFKHARYPKIDDLIKNLQEGVQLEDIVNNVSEGVIKVHLIDVGEEFDDRLDYILKEGVRDVTHIAHVRLYIQPQHLKFRNKNLNRLDVEFPCPVILDIVEDLESADQNINQDKIIGQVLNQEFNYQPVIIERRKTVNKALSKYEHIIEMIIECDRRECISDAVEVAWKENATIGHFRQVAQRVALKGAAVTRNGFVIREIRKTLVKKILEQISNDFADTIHFTMMSPFKTDIKIDLPVGGFGEGLMHDINAIFYNIVSEIRTFIAAIFILFTPQDPNSVQWRNKVADATFDLLLKHREEITVRILNSTRRQHKRIFESLREELGLARDKKLPTMTGTERAPRTKLTSICYGTDFSGRDVIGVRAECFDHIYVAIDKHLAVLDKKTVYEVSNDIHVVDKYMEEKGIDLDTDHRRKLNAIVKKHSRTLMEQHSNLNMISTSSVKSVKGKIKELPCIVLYCSCKGVVPKNEPDFPASLTANGKVVDVDVREGYFCLFHARGYNDPLRLGCSIGTQNVKQSGTLGAVVYETDNPDIQGFLTCSHVLLPGHVITDTGPSSEIDDKIRNGQVETLVVQPSFEDDERNHECGQLCSAKFGNIFYNGGFYGVDVAYVRMTTRQPAKAELPPAPYEDARRNGHTEDVSVGPPLTQIDEDDWGRCVVYKFGRTTDLTAGILDLDGNSVRREVLSRRMVGQTDSATRDLHNMYKITCCRKPFFEEGDSGAAVYIRQRNQIRIVGIAVGGLSNGRECYVIPIGAALESVNRPIQIRQF